MNYPKTSQYGEHEFIEQYFAELAKRHGVPLYCWKFLDIGAYDGVTLSNTHGLAQAGWHGVLVEPDPQHFCLLMETYKDNPKMELVCAGVLEDLGKWHSVIQNFWKCEGDITSTHCGDRREHFTTSPYRQMWVSLVPITAILEQLGHLHHFVNIDVEGLNLEVLADVMKHVIDPKMICVEIDPECQLEQMKAAVRLYYPEWNFKIIGGNLLAYE